MLVSHGVVKVFGFAAVVAVTRIVTEADYGLYAYAMGLVASAVPFMGFGAFQAFVRYSALAPSQSAKFDLHRYALGWGFLGAASLSLIVSLLAPSICRDLPESAPIMGVLAWVIASTFVMEHTKGLARALHLNRMSAQIDLAFAALLLAGAFFGTRAFGIEGYAWAVVLSRWPLPCPSWCASACTAGPGAGSGSAWRALRDSGPMDCTPQPAPCSVRPSLRWTSTCSDACGWSRRMTLPSTAWRG